MSDHPFDLGPLFAEAKRTGKWFYGAYHDIWFSPDELEREHANGNFRWGAVNWKLRDPRERLQELDRKAESAILNRAAFIARMR